MNQNKNQLATTTGTRVALKNVSKSLNITNKLLAEVDNFGKHWEWWLSLDDKWRMFLLKDGLALDCVNYSWLWNEDTEEHDFIINQLNIDWLDKDSMRPYLKQLLLLSNFKLIFDKVSDISPLAHLTNLIILILFNNQGNRTTKPLKSKNRLNCEQKGEPSCSPIRLII